jgi:hypothetical protein
LAFVFLTLRFAHYVIPAEQLNIPFIGRKVAQEGIEGGVYGILR